MHQAKKKKRKRKKNRDEENDIGIDIDMDMDMDMDIEFALSLFSVLYFAETTGKKGNQGFLLNPIQTHKQYTNTYTNTNKGYSVLFWCLCGL